MTNTVKSVEVRCPVCRCSGADAPTCPGCGWQMVAGPWLGGITEDRRRRFDEDLATATRRFDLAAAARGAGFPVAGDDALLAELVGFVRGGTPTSDEIHAARTRSGAVESMPVWDVLGPALGWLAEAPSGARTLTVVDVSATGLHVVAVRIDGVGALAFAGRSRQIPWTALFPMLPSSAGEALFLLAGGVGVGQVAVELDLEAARQLLPQAGDGSRVVVLQRLFGWPGVDTVVALLPTAHRVHGEPIGDEFLRRGSAYLPLPVAYRLFIVDVDDAGDTGFVLLRLFSAGAVAVETRPVTQSLTLPVGASEIVVAVIADELDLPLEQRTLLSIIRCPGRHELTVEFVLESPGVVTVNVASAVHREEVAASEWPTLLATIPARYEPSKASADVVFAVELAGSESTVDRRCALIAEVIAETVARHPNPSGVRVAVLGYREHLSRRREQAIHRRGFTALHDAGKIAEGLPMSKIIEPDVAPLEDALASATKLPWAPNVSRSLLVIGSRAPYVDPLGSCPNDFDWEQSLRRLRSADVRVHAVWDPPASLAPNSRFGVMVERVWKQLGRPRGPRRLDAVTARDIVGDFFPRVAEHVVPLNFPIKATQKMQEIDR
ncbi:hypothetical protein [Nocardia sp. NPDC003183]